MNLDNKGEFLIRITIILILFGSISGGLYYLLSKQMPEILEVEASQIIEEPTEEIVEPKMVWPEEKNTTLPEEELSKEEKAVEEKPIADENKTKIIYPKYLATTECRGISKTETKNKTVALTFDDGPFRGWTDRYLRVLEDHGVVATFFLTGRMVEAYPAGLQNILKAGHEVGNHSRTHRLLTNLSEEDVGHELFYSNVILFRHGGVSPTIFRPPFGGRNRQIDALAQAQGMRTIMWSVDSWDYTNLSAKEMVRRVVSRTRSGGNILFHEGRRNTLSALPSIIQELQERGFQFVTVSDLLCIMPDTYWTP